MKVNVLARTGSWQEGIDATGPHMSFLLMITAWGYSSLLTASLRPNSSYNQNRGIAPRVCKSRGGRLINKLLGWISTAGEERGTDLSSRTRASISSTVTRVESIIKALFLTFGVAWNPNGIPLNVL